MDLAKRKTSVRIRCLQSSNYFADKSNLRLLFQPLFLDILTAPMLLLISMIYG
jgi:hypothetical protein